MREERERDKERRYQRVLQNSREPRIVLPLDQQHLKYRFLYECRRNLYDSRALVVTK